MLKFDVQPYNPALCGAILQVWNDGEWGQKFPLTERLWRQQVEGDSNFKPDDFIGAFDDGGNLLGFALTKQFRGLATNPDMAAYDKLGWLSALVVAPQWQGYGLGSALLNLAEQRIGEAGKARIVLGGSFRHFLPGVPQSSALTLDFFQKRGYNLEKEHADAFDLRHTLTTYSTLPPVPAIASGEFYFSNAQPTDQAALLEFLAQHFAGRWRYEMVVNLADGGDIGEVILLRQRDGHIEGFLQTGHKDSPIISNSLFWYPLLGENYGGIGPLGVSIKVRGRNLGLALVDAGVRYLISRGVTECAIDWTSQALLNFYGKLGFEVWRVFSLMAKEI